tara:strand:+ start:140 stop:469 length:330 start_codon:yes stop_codon:yes gene_type:complete
MFWSGKGLLGIAIPAGWICVISFFAQFFPNGGSSFSGFFLFLLVVGSSYTTWKVGRKLNKHPGRVKELDQTIRVGPMHTLYFIPLESWAFIYPIILLIFAIASKIYYSQ